MVSFGATHNFIRKAESKWLNILWHQDNRKYESRQLNGPTHFRSCKENFDQIGDLD